MVFFYLCTYYKKSERHYSAINVINLTFVIVVLLVLRKSSDDGIEIILK